MHKINGHLEILQKGFGLLRSIENNFIPSPDDPYVPAGLIKQYDLPEGILIEGLGAGSGAQGSLVLDFIQTINGITLRDYLQVKPIHKKTSINPTHRFVLTTGPDDLTGKALDLIVPMGRGQRGLIISPPKSGKTTILQHMANAISTKNDNTHVFVLLVDERPEEVTDFKRGLSKTHVLSSSADQGISDHLRITRLAINTALRWTEMGHDAVVLIDSLTRMSRAFNTRTQSHGRTMTGGLGANALTIPRQIFGSARNLEEGGSLTIVATILVDTGSKMDDIIYQEFKGTGNLDLVLSRKCAEHRLWPAINIHDSGTRKEELLLSKAEHRKIIDMRRALGSMDELKALTYFLEHLNVKGKV
jgi:transcription termination factor Rho